MPASSCCCSQRGAGRAWGDLCCAYHDGLALVLEDVAGAADLVATAQAQEHELVGGVYGLDVVGLHGGVLALGRHGCRGGRADGRGEGAR